MAAKTTDRRTALSGLLRSKAFERLLIVAAVAAVLVAFGAWFAMARPFGADAVSSHSPATSAGSGATSAAAPSTTSEPPTSSAAPSAPTVATEQPAEQDAGTTTTSAPAAGPPAPSQDFLDQVTDSGLAPPVDDAQKLAMARDVCEEMGYGATPEDMVRALTFAGATDEEAANFVELAITNICPQYAR